MSDGRGPSGGYRCEPLGIYVDEAGVSHRVHVLQPDQLSWEILDTPDQGESVVIERLTGELESADTAAAVALDYMTQVHRRAA
jgi:hypothetical protein